MITIGFGNFVPLAQLYLAIIIARLVGLDIASRLQNPEPPAASSSREHNRFIH